MKKLTLLLITLGMLITTVYAYNLTTTVQGNQLTTTVNNGESVIITYNDVVGYTFSNWTATGITLASPTSKQITFTMPSNDVTVEPVMIQDVKYTLKWTINGVSKSAQKAPGESITLTAEAITGYEFTGWTATGITVDNIATITFTMPSNDVTIVANFEKLSWNAPVVVSGLTPVNWNGNSWETTTEANWEYDYNSVAEATHSTVEGNGNGKWANAQTSDGSLYVWIPRYSYKITSGEHSNGKSWNSLTADGTNKIEIKFSNGTTDDTSDSYITHPAFVFGDDDLTGIWVAKYEASRNDATSSSAGSGTTVSSKPGVVAWTNVTINDVFNYTYNLNRNLGSHMMKNSEWGAVAYLTNAIGRIPYINNSSSYITGNAGGSQDASSASGVTNAWNTSNGVKASTTHNIYGIYDMNGGAWEYVASYVNNANSSLTNNGSNLVNAISKYKENYPVGSSDSQINNYASWNSIKGDAIYEISNSGTGSSGSWDSDYSSSPSSSAAFFVRGGGYNNSVNSGIFAFGGSSGKTDGFRVTLVPESNTSERLPWNVPVITSDLIPVNWNGSSWIATSETNWDYNYNSVATATHSTVAGNGNGKWANAQTTDGSLYVWIPRYSYKITSGNHSDGNSWNSLSNSGTNKIEIKFSDGIMDDTSENYITHPAFNFGGTQLTGIWVAKYEASRNDATSSSAGSGTTVSSKPGVVSWRDITVSEMFDYAYNLNRSIESHMMKNSEWGAVAYLTNAIGRIPYINNSSSYITGNAGGSQDASSASGVTNAWNTSNGVKASTTHNVYGIYDISGGAEEYVSAYVNNGNEFLTSFGSSLVNASAKYKDVYPKGSSDSSANNYAAWSDIKGDAIYETSNSGAANNSSWDSDYSRASQTNMPFLKRGGSSSNLSNAGIFHFQQENGFSSGTFRVVFSIL